MEPDQAHDLLGAVEQRLEEVEQLPDPVARERATAVAQALLDLYGSALERIVDRLARADGGRSLARGLVEDELVSHLLLVYDLHPVPLQERVRSALAQVRPYLESHGGDVELLGVEGGTVKLSLAGSCSGCPSSTMTLKLAIEDAIHKAAPEIEQVLAEGVSAPDAQHTGQLLQIAGSPAAARGPELPRLQGGSAAAQGPELLQIEGTPGEAAPSAPARWQMAGGVPELSGGGALVKAIAGEPILFLRIGGSLYSYRPRCAACQHSLDGAALAGAELSCPSCGARYDALRAGRCLDSPQLHLEPVPLLIDEDGLAKVALGSVA